MSRSLNVLSKILALTASTNPNEAKAWDYSVKTTRQAFWKMVEKGEEADIFDLVFSELTIEQCKRINKLIDSKIWTELYLEEKN